MFGKRYVAQLIDRSAENPADRRRFLKTASVTVGGQANIIPADGNGLAFGRTPGRTPGQVLSVAYLTPEVANSGGFYPHTRTASTVSCTSS